MYLDPSFAFDEVQSCVRKLSYQNTLIIINKSQPNLSSQVLIPLHAISSRLASPGHLAISRCRINNSRNDLRHWYELMAFTESVFRVRIHLKLLGTVVVDQARENQWNIWEVSFKKCAKRIELNSYLKWDL